MYIGLHRFSHTWLKYTQKQKQKYIEKIAKGTTDPGVDCFDQ